MNLLRRCIRTLLATWPVLVALLAVATVSHDVAMAAHPHEPPIPAGVVEANVAHAFGTVHDGLRRETHRAVHLLATGAPCPTESCPELNDCGLVRVSNPIPAPSPNRVAAGAAGIATQLQSETRSNRPVSAIEPVHPPGVRRALLQVFLN